MPFVGGFALCLLAMPGETLLATGFDEPSLFFHAQPPGKAVSLDQMKSALAARSAPCVLVLRRKELEALGLNADAVAPNWRKVDGYNYVKAWHERVWINRWQPPPHAEQQGRTR